MMEFLQFAFQDGWHFAGCLVMLALVCWAIANFTPINVITKHEHSHEFWKAKEHDDN